MNHITQISVFIQNRTGSLTRVTGLLAQAGVDLRAFSIADTSDYGILRIIVDKPDLAVETLHSVGINVAKTPVLALGIPDQPGGMHTALEAFAKLGIDIQYAYAFFSRSHGQACVIVRVDEPDRTAQLLADAGVRVMSEEEFGFAHA